MSDRRLGHLSRRFNFGGNEKSDEIYENKRVLRGLTELDSHTHGYIGQIRSYPWVYRSNWVIPGGYIDQTGSYPVGATVKYGHTQNVSKFSPEIIKNDPKK